MSKLFRFADVKDFQREFCFNSLLNVVLQVDELSGGESPRTENRGLKLLYL